MKARKIKVRAPRGTIYRHGPSFRAEVMIEGKRARQSFPTEEEAQEWLVNQVRRSMHGISVDKARLTVSQLSELFLEAKEASDIKPTTLVNYRAHIPFAIAAFGSVPVQQLTPLHLTRLLGQLKKGGIQTVGRTPDGKPKTVTHKPLSARYIRAIYTTIHTMFSWAMQQDILDRNVCDRVRGPQVRPSNLVVWDMGQVNQFLSHINGQRMEALFWVFLCTGMRKGELVGLKWEDVNLETGEIVIRRRVVRINRAGIDIDTPKTSAGSRVVQIPKDALKKLTEWKERQALERLVSGDRWLDDGWVFTTARICSNTSPGKHLDPRWVWTLLKDAIDKAKLPPVTVHGLRHTFATMLLNNNVPIKDVQEVLGHAKPSHTLNLYWRTQVGSAKRVSASVGELICPTIAPQATTKEEPQRSSNSETACVRPHVHPGGNRR